MKKLLLVALVVLFALPAQVEAARLFSSGCELQGDSPATATDLLEWDTETSGTGSTVNINATIKRSGLSSCRSTSGGSGGWALFIHQFLGTAGPGPYFIRFYLYIDTAPSADTTVMVWGNSTDTRNQLVVRSDRTLRMVDADDSTVMDSYATPLELATWYRVEMRYEDATNGMEVRLDGTTVLGPATCTSCANVSDVWVGLDGDIGPPSGVFYYDDIAINDTSGSTQTSWPGAGSIVHMQPDGSAGDNNGASAGDCASVDEITPDDASTIANLDANSDIIDCTVEDSSSAGIDSYDTVTLVQVGARHAENPSGTGSLTYELRAKSASGGTVSSGSTVSHNDGTYSTNGDNGTPPRNYSLTSYTDPSSTVSVTGTPSTVSTQLRSSSASVTVPSDATLAVLLITGYDGSSFTLSSASLGGEAFATPIVNTFSDSYTGAAILENPPTGTQTFAWTFTGGGSLDEGALISIVYVKNYAAGDAVRDSDSHDVNGTGTSAVTLTTETTDLVIGQHQQDGASIAAVSGQTTLVNNYTVDVIVADVIQLNAPGSPSSVVSGPTSVSWPATVAVAIKSATPSAWTPTGTNSLDNMQIGMNASDAAPDIGLSTLWALVEYIDGVAPGAAEKMRARLNGGRFKLSGGRFRLLSN